MSVKWGQFRMLTIPETYYKNNEDYITIPAIHKFMKKHNDGNFKLSLPRKELMEAIVDYGNENPENEEIVLSWIDDVIIEGIKDVYLTFLPVKNDAMKYTLADEVKCERYINAYLSDSICRHICQNRYNQNLLLISCELINTTYGKKIIFVFCRKLFIHNKKEMHTRGIDYPIIAEYYLDSQCLLVRAKPRSNLYDFNETGFDIEKAQSTTIDKQIKEVKDKVINILQLEAVDKNFACEMLKSRIFNVLDKYTNTPLEIKTVMDNSNGVISTIVDGIMNICDREENCSDVTTQRQDILSDIENLLEKYLSINWKNNDVFIKDREAYPVKLSATDEEESKVEQTAAMAEPLQTKALFFDNKKMLYKSCKCDGVTFQWKRISNDMFEDHFAVKIYANPKGDCVFKFPKYTESEDINNVIFSIINDEEFSN